MEVFSFYYCYYYFYVRIILLFVNQWNRGQYSLKGLNKNCFSKSFIFLTIILSITCWEHLLQKVTQHNTTQQCNSKCYWVLSHSLTNGRADRSSRTQPGRWQRREPSKIRRWRWTLIRRTPPRRRFQWTPEYWLGEHRIGHWVDSVHRSGS